ncbi:MAG: AAA family ATPase [Bacillota bacterium]|nr:AAA family ATPase [Bacillota bacterium]
MKLILENIGKIKEASIEINGITIIAGENNTGKSTVGRALFAVFNSFNNVKERIENARIDNMRTLLQLIITTAVPQQALALDLNEIAKTIVSRIDEYRKAELLDVRDNIVELISQYQFRYSESKNLAETFRDNVKLEEMSRITNVLNVSDEKFLNHVLRRYLDTEFNGQVCNIFTEDDGKIELHVGKNIITVSIGSERSIDVLNSSRLSLHTEAIYIDNPFLLDELSAAKYVLRSITYHQDHREHLHTKLLAPAAEVNVFDEIIIKDKLDRVYERISSACDGEVIRERYSGLDSRVAGFQKKGSDKVLDIRNLSTGLKTFVIIKMLLGNGAIHYNGTIIMDEPEIHLHPKWQLLFAELIVLIQKEFGMHVLLNTHSPYFLNAIEVYSVKHGIDDKCKYYLAESQDEGAVIKDVTDNIELIYRKLAEPFQDLENTRGQL